MIGPPTAEGMRGALQAWDPVNQKLIWRVDGGGGIGGGTMTTAGNLVFHVVNDGRFRAVTADKGEVLYEIQTGRKLQMQTMDVALMELYQKGEITYDTALSAAREPNAIRHKVA